jgi:hypothetical protein
MVRRLLTATVIAAAASFALALPQIVIGAEPEQLPSKSDQSCLKCHEDYAKKPGLLAGKLADASIKAKTIQLQIGPETEIIYFDDSTVLKNAPSFPEIPKTESIRVTYIKKDGKIFAKEVEVKKGLAVPQEKLISAQEVAKLVALGPEKGKYVLLDSRPTDMFNEGHIPTASSMPFFAFDKLQEKLLPQDKEILQIYYCAGFS